jgi:diguanylate cyclase (GGDEF)-like protein
MERQQEEERDVAKQMAYTDSLTRVKNTHAYVEKEKQVDHRIVEQELKEFGVVVFDLNDLKKVNDTKGHDAGDEYIRKSCHFICVTFQHSPVFRVGGDEFVAFLEGEDYRNRKELLAAFETQMEENLRRGEFVIASGLAVFRPGYDYSYRRVFERADQRMYDRKGSLKAMANISPPPSPPPHT